MDLRKHAAMYHQQTLLLALHIVFANASLIIEKDNWSLENPLCNDGNTAEIVPFFFKEKHSNYYACSNI